MNRLIIALFLALTFSITGCSPRYAIVAVTTIDANSNSGVYSKVYSGKDGLYLGDAPALNYLISKKNIGKHRTMCLIVEAECYKTKWQIIEVTKWAKTEADARDAVNVNKVLFKLEADTCCLNNR
jgi:hypothetical protein